jgi:hypothetical protein
MHGEAEVVHGADVVGREVQKGHGGMRAGAEQLHDAQSGGSEWEA